MIQHVIQILKKIDVQLFQFGNISVSNKFFNSIMPVITHKNFLIVCAILYLVYAASKVKKKKKIVCTAILAIALSDVVSARLLKPFFHRSRPCHTLTNVIQRVDVARSYSFPSSHAANSFSFAAAVSFFYVSGTYFIVSFAAIVAFSRVYVGVHYPADVLFGAIVGVLCAYIVYRLFNRPTTTLSE